MAKISLALLVCLGLFGAVLSNSLREAWDEWKDNVWDHFDGDWDYEGKYGADNWGEFYEKCRDDVEDQSPIDLPHFEDLSASTEELDLDFANFDDLTDDLCEMEDDGRAAKAICKSDRLRVKGLGAEPGDEYIVSEFEVHDGEHSIDGRKYPVELQLLSYNAKYDDVEEARKHDDGLAVMGVFVKASGESADSVLSSSESVLDSMSSESNSATSLSNSVSNSLSESSSDEDSIQSSQRESEIEDRDDLDNDDFEPVLKAMKHLKPKRGSHSVRMNVLKKLLPKNTRHFYRYEGSLTKPPCNPATWTVFRKPIRISSSQLNALRKLKNAHHHDKVNHRPTQKGHGRKISRN